MIQILICFGTRPEYIKIKSLIDNLQNIKIKTCFTGQHKDLLKNINSDYILNFEDNLTNNRLNDIFINIMKYTYIFDNIDYVLVQGDTTTACAIAISAFNNKKKIIHLEAGLRSGDIANPFPEEMNRQIISKITNIHFCPTEFNKQNLLKENIQKNIYVVGNTGLDNINKNNCEYGNIILITLHRRDNENIINLWFEELEKISQKYSDIEFVIPLHPNPNIQKYKYMLKTIKVVEPMAHNDMINFIKKCKFVISDSGGLQEECSFLNKKIIVCRKTTERPESLNVHSVLCESPNLLANIVDNVINNYIINEICPYGDGNAWKNINKILQEII